MFLFEKYKPASIKDLLYHRDIADQLMHMASNEDVPHIIISGPPGGGKKTLVRFFLEALYDPDVNKTQRIKYVINSQSSKRETEIIQSNYHIVIEPTGTNHDKYILQEIITQYARHRSFNFFKTKRAFKTIVIYNIENLSGNSQAALRRTMEVYAHTCRFVMVCNNLSKVFDPLRSRCHIFSVPLPSLRNIASVVSHIAFAEDITLTKEQYQRILLESCGNISRAIWILDCIRLNTCSTLALDQVFNDVTDLIMGARIGTDAIKIFDNNVRANIYNILITNIRGSDVIMRLMDQLMRRINNDEINARVIQYAAEPEHNMTQGRRDITHIDYFVCSVMNEIHGCDEQDGTLIRPQDPNARAIPLVIANARAKAKAKAEAKNKPDSKSVSKPAPKTQTKPAPKATNKAGSKTRATRPAGLASPKPKATPKLKATTKTIKSEK
ncbi:Replication factor C small subunit [uncultured virus]|nr:Replication factor C small subunit [uncultured virus]